jgi:hypothetical protein
MKKPVSLDEHNAASFAFQARDVVRYSQPRACWYTRGNRGWTRCSEGELARHARRVAQHVEAEAKKGHKDYKHREVLRRCALRLQQPGGISQMIAAARSVRVVQTDLFIEAELPQD